MAEKQKKSPLSDPEKEKIKQELATERDEEGKKITRKEIAKKHNISEVHLSRLSKDWGLTKRDVTRELIDTTKAETEVKKAVTQELVKEDRERLELVLQTGKQCLDEFGVQAKDHGYTSVVDYLAHCVDFWHDNRLEIEELREDLAITKSTMNVLMREIDPELSRLKREKTISEMAMLQLLKTGKIEDNLLKEYLKT